MVYCITVKDLRKAMRGMSPDTQICVSRDGSDSQLLAAVGCTKVKALSRFDTDELVIHSVVTG